MFGCTALHYAVIEKDMEILTLLLDNGADADVLDNMNRTPLDVAHIYSSDNQIVEKLSFLKQH
jgi:ankyrin repeat protein